MLCLADYGAPCRSGTTNSTCSESLHCNSCGSCAFEHLLGDEMQGFVGCRSVLADAYKCAALIGCDPKALDCNERLGCWYEYANLQNCFFCNTTVSADVKASNPCILHDCADPGMARLTLVLISTGVVCAALIVFSICVCVYERRKKRHQYIEVH